MNPDRPQATAQDAIECLLRVIRQMTLDMIAKAGGIEKIGAHRITDAVIRRLFALVAGSNEGDRDLPRFFGPGLA